MSDGYHRGRTFSGHTIEDRCPCQQESCGLVAFERADPDCDQHGRNHMPRSMRQGHVPDDCPGGTDLETVLRLAQEALRGASGRCPTHDLAPPEAGECRDCIQAHRIRKAVFAFGVAADQLNTEHPTPTAREAYL
ncbi:hypothetical protein [Sphaerisporangium aureirubrum]|uniref:Uncharacterized protein n=1 Tax=Sphaerisporangium aureirubrum TaxID=1544736 RepID=A0ABW1NE05_9ACTN